MQYSSKDYEFLGKQVAAGRYASRSTLVLSVILALLLGLCLGRYVFPNNSGLASRGERRPIGQSEPSAIASAVNPNNQILQAIVEHEDAVRKDPANLEAWVHLGNLFFDAKEPAKSVNAYNKALELNPDMPDVLVDCGVMYRALKQYDKALEYFGKATQINPKHEHALFNSGIVLIFDLNKKDEGLDFWRKLVAVNPQAKAPSGDLVSKIIQDLEKQ